MDKAWAVEQLRGFVRGVSVLEDIDLARYRIGGELPDELATESRETEDELVQHEPIMRMLMNAAQPELGNYESPDDSSWRWREAKERALQAIGLFTLGVEAEERMRPDAPQLAADRLHPWVWDAARVLWEGGSHQDSVHTAARAINARLKQKLGRQDLSEAALCREAFSLKDPAPGRPRLRFSGDRTSETWRSRQQGAVDFGAGCFEAIRNPAVHEHELDLPEQIALEQLSALSLLARWVDESDVERDVSSPVGVHESGTQRRVQL